MRGYIKLKKYFYIIMGNGDLGLIRLCTTIIFCKNLSLLLI